MVEKLTQEYLKECLHYDPDTGIFTWLVRPRSHFKDGIRNRAERICNICNTIYARCIAGSKDKKGYIVIRIDNKGYFAHRLSWLYVYGYCPENEIDHIGDKDEFGNKNPDNKSDNRIVNLREVGDICQMQNTVIRKDNTSGVKGVSWNKSGRKWRSYIAIHKKQKHLGYFINFNDAVKTRWAEERDNSKWDCSTDSSAYNYLKENNLLEEENI